MAGGPFMLGPRDEAKPRLTALLSELEMTRRYTETIVRGLSASGLAAAPSSGKNSIGAVLSHIAAAEAVMQRVTTIGEAFPEGSEDERPAFGFEADPLAGSELGAYLEQLGNVRERTLQLFAEKGDAWLDEPRTFLMNPANYHYYWFHLVLDEARHQGQVILLRKYLIEGADPDFEPYVGLAAKQS